MNSEEARPRCSRCKSAKPLSDFPWKFKDRGIRGSLCRRCQSEYGREHYEANRARYIAQAKEQKRRLALERTAWLIDYFKDNRCVDCGEGDAVVLEFDHLGDKAFAIGANLTTRSWRSILAEIAKCEVVCANCHRRRTAARRGSVRAMLSMD